MGFFCLEMCLYLCGWPRAAFGVEGTGLFLPEADIYIEWRGGGGGGGLAHAGHSH